MRALNWRALLVGAAILAAVLANLYVVFAVWRRIFAVLQASDPAVPVPGSGQAPSEPLPLDRERKIDMKRVEAEEQKSSLKPPSTWIRVHVSQVQDTRQVVSYPTTRPFPESGSAFTRRVTKFPQNVDKLNETSTVALGHHRNRHNLHHRHRHPSHEKDPSGPEKAVDEVEKDPNEKDNNYQYSLHEKILGETPKQGITTSTTARPKHVKTPAELLRANLRRQQESPADGGAHTVLPLIRVTATELRRLAPTRPTSTAPSATSSPSGVINDQLTIVTALLDIGRERWPHYGRPFFKYHDFMRNVLRVRAPMVIFVDERSTAFVRQERAAAGLFNHTVIYEITIEDLPLFRYHRQMQQIMDYELNGGGWRPTWEESMRSHPETFNYMYDTVVNSKAYFLHNASITNHFGTEFFVWLDGGYGHGESHYFPADYQWRPQFPSGKITLIKLTPETDQLGRYLLELLYRQDIAVVSGGFLAGDRATLARFYERYHWTLIDLLMRQRVIDDDQTVLVMLINEAPELFNVVHGDWFDAFTLF